MRAHGTRTRYVHEKCRCDRCKRANADYERARHRQIERPDTHWAPAVNLAEAREHLERLQAAGVGLRAVSAHTGLSRTTLNKILHGRVKRILPSTRDRILGTGTTAAADGAFVDASRTWRLIDRIKTLRKLTNADIAVLLGYKSPALQFGKDQIMAKSARKVEALARRLGVL